MGPTNSESERFVAALRQDRSLRQEVQDLASDREALHERVRAMGYSVTRRELDSIVASSTELSDEELEQAAGGEDPWSPKP
jgi:predicted ribosomally synthesized peptide with nif11-like leader